MDNEHKKIDSLDHEAHVIRTGLTIESSLFNLECTINKEDHLGPLILKLKPILRRNPETLFSGSPGNSPISRRIANCASQVQAVWTFLDQLYLLIDLPEPSKVDEQLPEKNDVSTKRAKARQ